MTDVSKDLLPLKRILSRINYHADMYTVMSDFFAVAACEISRSVDLVTARQKNEFLAYVRKKYTDDEMSIFGSAFGETIRLFSTCGLNDWLGDLYMNSETSADKAGQFFTPYHVSKMIAKCVADQTIERIDNGENVVVVSEPACGSGGMILALCDVLQESGINYCEHVIADCSDIDQRCVHMAYVQMSLAGIPAVIRLQDTLSTETPGREWHTPALIFNWMKFGGYVRRRCG